MTILSHKEIMDLFKHGAIVDVQSRLLEMQEWVTQLQCENKALRQQLHEVKSDLRFLVKELRQPVVV
jgi:predicted RNase H-like nuclease (RuvC/YqgF family)